MKSQNLPLTEEDIRFINQVYKPKIHGNMLTLAIVWTVIVFIAPFYQYRGMSKSLYERLGYEEAFLWCFFMFLVLWLIGVYYSRRNIKKDLNSSKKIQEFGEIKRKDWKSSNKFKLFFDNQKFDKLDITLNKNEFYTCFKGDYVEIEYLQYSECLVRYKIMNKEEFLRLTQDA